MLTSLEDPRILRILSQEGADHRWEVDLDRLIRGDDTLTRKSAGEAGIRALQRLLIFLGYSTTTGGAFVVDGDFGRGTNRGIAQFQFEHGLGAGVSREDLCYSCSWQNAHHRIVAVPEATLDLETLGVMLDSALAAIEENAITFGDLEDAMFHLDALDRQELLSCTEIVERYAALASAAIRTVKDEDEVEIRPEWVLAIIKQETGGICRPRFEQHKLSSQDKEDPSLDFAELRLRSMSIGLGQIMGFNFERVDAPSARQMLYSPAGDQVLYVARFLVPRAAVVSKDSPTQEDYRTIARFYNGSGYAKHFYHESLERWFREFSLILN